VQVLLVGDIAANVKSLFFLNGKLRCWGWDPDIAKWHWDQSQVNIRSNWKFGNY